jgi:hypothetical protein
VSDCVRSAESGTPDDQSGRGGATPTLALHLFPAHGVPAGMSFQRWIREKARVRYPRPAMKSLAGCRVGPIDAKTARGIIEQYEWLGGLSAHVLSCYALRSPEGEVLGVAVFGRASREAGELKGIGQGVCLSRGACVHFAPPNSASFLIRHATVRALNDHGAAFAFAYADPDAGEVGTVYQACGWFYIGTTGSHKAYLKPDGTIVRERQLRLRYHGTRERQAYGHNLSLSPELEPKNMRGADAVALGWKPLVDGPKYKYAWAADRATRDRLAALGQPYPKRGAAAQEGGQ